MTNTLTLPEKARVQFLTSAFVKGVQPVTYKKDNGNTVVESMPVFRSGTFRDSSGTQRSWDGLHIAQMKQHYDLLKGQGIFPDVPVRDGHPGFLVHGTPGTGAVVGYHTDLAVENLESAIDGEKYNFLLANFEFTDPAGAEKFANGTFRNRSAEVGEYTTNSESMFWPVYMGVAFVDIPAVEGLSTVSLNSKMSDNQRFIVMFDKEIKVPDPMPVPPVPTPTAFTFNLGAKTTTDFGQVQEFINSQTVKLTGLETENTSLKQFQVEQKEGSRKAFVKKLSDDKKILASDEDSLAAFALGLNDEQYATWCGHYDKATALPILAGGAQPPQNDPSRQTTHGAGGEDTRTPMEKLIETDEGTVLMHVRGNSPGIKDTASYNRLLKNAPDSSVLARVK